jgi:hypothetical protein
MQNKSKGYISGEETHLKINSKITSKHSKIVKNRNASSDMCPLSFKTYVWLSVSKLTTRVTSQALN